MPDYLIIEERLRAAIEASPSGLLMTDGRGRIVLVNHEIERLFKYDREELLGLGVDVLVPQQNRAAHADHRTGFGPHGQRRMGEGRELLGLRKDGVEIPVEIGLNTVETPEGVFVIAAIADVSARRAAEVERRRLEDRLRQSHKMEAVGALASGIAHTFNNLLGEIVGYADLIAHNVANDVVLQDVAALSQVAERGRQMVHLLLTFAHQESVERHAVDLRACVDTGITLLRAALPGLTDVRVRYAPALPRVLASETSVQQILMHVGTNAAEAMGGGGTLDVSVDTVTLPSEQPYPESLAAGKYLIVSIRDYGAGMDDTTRTRAMEPFFTTKPPGTGTGLGLSIVHGLMTEHGGAVDVESGQGTGTTVRCYFPAIAEAAPVIVRTSDVAAGHGERILFVDDEPGLVAISKRRLALIGYDVIGETSPASAMARLRAAPDAFDLVITDYTMPEMNGIQLIREIGRVRASLPVIMISGNQTWSPEDEKTCPNLKRVLEKPVTLQVLGAVLREVLS